MGDVMSLSSYTSKKISRLSIIMAVLVVFVHAYTAGDPIQAESKVGWLVQDFISQGVARSAVPFFFAYLVIFFLIGTEPIVDGSASGRVWF